MQDSNSIPRRGSGGVGVGRHVTSRPAFIGAVRYDPRVASLVVCDERCL